MVPAGWPLPVAFRTTKEALGLLGTPPVAGVAVFAEAAAVAMEVARQAQAEAVWINCVGQSHASAGQGGRTHRGGGATWGGRESLIPYLQPSWFHQRQDETTQPHKRARTDTDITSFGAHPGVTPGPSLELAPAGGVDQTYKLFIGGKHVRPDGGASFIAKGFEQQPMAEVPLAGG